METFEKMCECAGHSCLRYLVRCQNCGRTGGLSAKDSFEAIENWNNLRSTDDPLYSSDLS